MKFLLYIVLYFVIGFISVILILREYMATYEYKPSSVFDLSEDEQTDLLFAFVLWPLVLAVFIVFAVLNLMVVIANLGRKENDDGEKD